MRSLNKKQVYKSVEDKKVAAASDYEKIMMLYVAMLDRLNEMKHILGKSEKKQQDFETLKEKNGKVRAICNFLIDAIYDDEGTCLSDEMDKLYAYIKANSAHAFSSLDDEAAKRAILAVEELIDIWKATKG